MAVYTHRGWGWMWMLSVGQQFNTANHCRLNLYSGTMPDPVSYTEAAYTSSLIAKCDQTFFMTVRNEQGISSGFGIIGYKPLLGPTGPIPTTIATGTGTVTWAAMVNPTATSVFFLTTVTGIGTNSIVVINNQSDTGNVITAGDTVSVLNFTLTTVY